MTDPKVKEFRERLDALCFELGVQFRHEDGHGSGYLMIPEEGEDGGLKIHIRDKLKEPRAALSLTPEGLAARAEFEARAAASRETWESGRTVSTGPRTVMPDSIARSAALAASFVPLLDEDDCAVRGAVAASANPLAAAMQLEIENPGVYFKNLETSRSRSDVANVSNPSRHANLGPAPAITFPPLSETREQAETYYARWRTAEEAHARLIEQLAQVHRAYYQVCGQLADSDRELHAVRVLDAWAKKQTNPRRELRLIFGDGEWVCIASDRLRCFAEYHAASADEARIAAADALAKEDPSLLEGLT